MKARNIFSVIVISFFCGTFLLNGVYGADDPKNAKGETGRDIIKKSESLPEPKTAISKMIMNIYLTGGKVLEKKFEVYGRKEISSGVDGTMMQFTVPSKIKLLTHRVEGGKDQQWIKLTSGKPKKTAEIGKEKSFVGSNFCFEDLSPRKIDDYSYTYLKDQSLVMADGKSTKYDCYVVKGVKKAGDDIVYDKAEVYIRKTDYLPVRIDLYQKGELAKVLEMYEIETINGILTPRKTVMYKVDGEAAKPLTEIGIKTEIIIEKGYPQYNVPTSQLQLQLFKSEAM